MIVVMRAAAREREIADVVMRLCAGGASVQRLDGERVTLATPGAADEAAVRAMAGVEDVLKDGNGTPHARTRATPQAGPAVDEGRGVVVGRHLVGGDELFVIAGPCSVEDDDTMDRIARAVAACGAAALRAGAYKPRSSPYSFQGSGETGLAIARRAADAHGLLVVAEVLDATQIPVAGRYADVLQVGARNMYNTPLLRELGRSRTPVLLKRGMSATIEEWIGAAEYVMSAGNARVILCERGIRTFETATRNTLDLNAVAVVRERTHLPIVVDPSHGTGKRGYVEALSRAAVACGADGLLLEVHVEPDKALSDAAQTITTDTLRRIMRAAAAIRGALQEPVPAR